MIKLTFKGVDVMGKKNCVTKNVKTVKLNKGKIDNTTAFIFSCPGEKEFHNKKLVSHFTGENLDLLLKELSKKNDSNLIKEHIKYQCRYDYMITNASEKAHWKEYDHRSEPLDSEIKKNENILRLKKELSNVKMLFVFGNKAYTAVKKLAENKYLHCYIVFAPHLGNQGLNHIRKDFNGHNISQTACEYKKNKNQQINRKKKRIEVVADLIRKQLTQISYNYIKSYEKYETLSAIISDKHLSEIRK